VEGPQAGWDLIAPLLGCHLAAGLGWREGGRAKGRGREKDKGGRKGGRERGRKGGGERRTREGERE
jgi:hypothetical protein